MFGKADGDNRPLQEYARWLTAQGIDPTMLVTRLKFDTKSESPKLFFKAMRWLEQDEFEICREQGLSADAKKAVSATPAAMDGVGNTAAPVAVPGNRPTAAPAPAPAPAPAADVEPPAPPPKPRKPRAAAANGSAGAATVAAAPAPAAEPAEPTLISSAPVPPPAVATGNLANILDEWDD
jgi:hypothetical protein